MRHVEQVVTAAEDGEEGALLCQGLGARELRLRHVGLVRDRVRVRVRVRGGPAARARVRVRVIACATFGLDGLIAVHRALTRGILTRGILTRGVLTRGILTRGIPSWRCRRTSSPSCSRQPRRAHQGQLVRVKVRIGVGVRVRVRARARVRARVRVRVRARARARVRPVGVTRRRIAGRLQSLARVGRGTRLV